MGKRESNVLMPNRERDYILKVICPDTSGISASVLGFIYENDGFVSSSYNYGDPSTKKYFMRTIFRDAGGKLGSLDEIRIKFAPIGLKFNMQWEISDCGERPRVMIAVSKFGHCLVDLLHKTKAGQIPMKIEAVVSNHSDMKDLVEWYGIKYFHFPSTPDTRAENEEKILQLVDGLQIDLVVLARYMQILSPHMCESLNGKCINIHHSFLPSFKGAAPYSQAHEKGVKIVGATAHYVTPDLDEGPIIEQAVERIDHTYTPEDIGVTVRDLETIILSRAVKWHTEGRILLNGNKTIVFK
jgi:formyltetrahydrofolate deformylase